MRRRFIGHLLKAGVADYRRQAGCLDVRVIEKSFPAGYEVARSTRRTLCRLAPADCRANQTC